MSFFIIVLGARGNLDGLSNEYIRELINDNL